MADKGNETGTEGPAITAAQALEFLFPDWMVEEKLTIGEAIFADVYSRTLNPVGAYEDAGEELTGNKVVDAKRADGMLKRRKLSRVISRLIQERTGLPTVWAVDKLAGIASVDLPDLIEWDENGRPTIKASSLMTPRERSAIASMKRDPETGEIEIKMFDKLVALDKLVRIQGLFRDKLEVTGGGGGPLKVILSKEDQTVL